MFIDTHAHLEFEDFDVDFDEVLERAKKEQVSSIITLGVDIERAKKTLKIVNDHNGLYAGVGLHPNDTIAANLEEAMLEFEEMIAHSEKIVAIGETGLDYFRTDPEDFEKTRQVQHDFFHAHIKLALKHDLPIIVHLRGEKTYLDALSVLNEYDDLRSVIHCFGGTVQQAHQFVEAGSLISFTGIITFKNADEMRGVVREIPLEKIMIETDCPYLAPEPHRGKRNEPAFVPLVAQKIAEIKNVSPEEVAKITTENAQRFFKLGLDKK